MKKKKPLIILLIILALLLSPLLDSDVRTYISDNWTSFKYNTLKIEPPGCPVGTDEWYARRDSYEKIP